MIGVDEKTQKEVSNGLFLLKNKVMLFEFYHVGMNAEYIKSKQN